jgi:hypothetical protein
LGTLIHDASKTELVAVPGGTFHMGFSVDDVLSVVRLVDADASSWFPLKFPPG